MSNPLDALFRPTVAPEPAARPGPTAGPGTTTDPVRPRRSGTDVASAPPARTRGSHTRAGNAMPRTRTALLTGASQVVGATGTRIAMAQVAAAAGVAKATLYNHFRTREAVLDALLHAEIEAVIGATRGRGMTDALTIAAQRISRHPVRAGLAHVEPATLARLAALDAGSAGWQAASTAVTDLLRTHGRGGEMLVLRWLASFLLAPGDDAAIRADADALVAGLPHRRPMPAAG